MLIAFCLVPESIHGQTWTGTTDGNWNNTGNWNPATVPNSSGATATFGLSNTNAITLSASTEVNSITFTSNATSTYTITVAPTLSLTISGAGLTNNSGITENFVTAVDGSGNSGTVNFTNNATAGNATQFTNNGGNVSGAGNGGITQFSGESSAGSATIVNNGGTNGGAGGATYFSGSADGGTARAITNGNGIFDISAQDGGMNIGSIEGSGTYFLGANTLTIGGNNLSTTVSGVIADGGKNGGSGGSLVLTGTGTLTLTGANTYTGTTSIINGATLHASTAGALPAPASDGGTGTVRSALVMDQTGTGGSTLSLGANQSVASLTGAVLSQVNLNANTLTIGATNAATNAEFDGVIGDDGLGGSLTKDGASTQILGGANTYTGLTTVQAGVLRVDGSLAVGSTVNVNNGATLSGSGTIAGSVNILSGGILQSGDALPGTLTIGNLVLNSGSNSNFRLVQSGVIGGVNDLANVTTNLTIGGALNVTQLAGFGIGTYPLFTYGGALTNNGFSAINGLAGFSTSIFTGIAGEVDLVVSLGTAQYWDGTGAVNDGVIGGGSGNWNTSANNWTNASGTVNSTWQNGTAFFAGTGGTVTLAAAISAQGLIFSATGYSITGTSAALNLSGSTPTINVTNPGDSATISAKLTGTSGLRATGAGTLILANASNSYSGGTSISSGTVQIGTTTSAGSIGAGGISIGNGGMLLLVNLNGNTLASDIANGVGTVGTFNIDSARAITLSGTLTDGVTGQLALTQSGTATAILTNASNTYSGATTVVIGILQIGTTSTAGSIGPSSVVSIADNGTLTLVNVQGNVLANNITNGLGGSGLVINNSTLPTTLSGSLSDGAGILAINQSGTGTTTLSGNNTYSGPTTVTGGTLQIGDGVTTGTALATSAIAVSGTGTLALNLVPGTSFSNAIVLSAAGASVKGVNTGANTQTISGNISGLGTVNQTGTGTTILTGTNTYTGATNVNAGTLEVDGSLAAASTVNIATAGTLDVVGTIGGKVTLTGNGTINLSGSISFNSDFTVVTLAGGLIGGTLTSTGGNWTGIGTVNGAITSSGRQFHHPQQRGLLDDMAGVNVTGGTITGGGDPGNSNLLAGNLNYTSSASSTFRCGDSSIVERPASLRSP